MKKVILFDYGGVIANHHQDPAEQKLCQLFCTTRKQLRNLLSEKSAEGNAFRKNEVSESEFWRRIAVLCNIRRDKLPDDIELSRLWAETYTVSQEVISVVEAIRPNCVRGILTNIDSGRFGYLSKSGTIRQAFILLYGSFQYGLSKYEVELWRKVDQDIRNSMGQDVEIYYVDDRLDHVRSAEKCHWRGILYDNPDELRRQLRELGLVEL